MRDRPYINVYCDVEKIQDKKVKDLSNKELADLLAVRIVGNNKPMAARYFAEYEKSDIFLDGLGNHCYDNLSQARECTRDDAEGIALLVKIGTLQLEDT
jgi:glycosylphosphatidylinositol transamidase (GPIT) subunit GPI8